MGKITTPDWILKGSKKPNKENKDRSFKIKACPKCGSDNVGVILTGEEGKGNGEWECKKCKWKGRDVKEEEVNEEEFLKRMEGK